MLKHLGGTMIKFSFLRLIVVGVVILGVASSGVSVAFAAAPTNDDFDSAKVIPGTTAAFIFSDTLNTTDATIAPDDPACGSNTVWYSFTPTAAGQININTNGSNYDASLSVYTGSRGALNTVVACTGGLPAQTAFSATAGQTYYIMIGSFDCCHSFTLVFNVLTAPLATNDDFANATVIPATTSTFTFNDIVDTSQATFSSGDPTCAGGNTVWYKLTPTQNTRINLKNDNSAFQAYGRVFTGSRENPTNVIGCTFSPFNFAFTAVANQTYYIMIENTNFCCGVNSFVLSLTVTGRPPFNLGVSIAADGTVNSQTGVATLHGTLTCTNSSAPGIDLVLQQKVGRLSSVSGEAPVFLSSCFGVTPWSTTVVPVKGAFAGGAAYAIANANACATVGFDTECVFVHAEGTVKLKGSSH